MNTFFMSLGEKNINEIHHNSHIQANKIFFYLQISPAICLKSALVTGEWFVFIMSLMVPLYDEKTFYFKNFKKCFVG